jgi:hypothetical protein
MLCDLFIYWYILTKNQCLSFKSYFGWFGIMRICLNLAPSFIKIERKILKSLFQSFHFRELSFSNSLSFLFLNVRLIYISISYSIRLLHRKWKKLRSLMASRTRFFWYTYLNDSQSSFHFFWALNKLFL